MRVLLGQVSPVIGDVQGNLALCRAAIATARAERCTLVVLPELVLSGYPPRDLLERGDLIAACRAAAMQLAAESAGLTVVFGTPLEDVMGLRNSAVVAHNGRIAHIVHKCLLPTYDVFDEARWFVPGRPCGPVQIPGMRLGVTICEDIWNVADGPDAGALGTGRYPDDPVPSLAGTCDVVVNLSASPFHMGKPALRRQLVRQQAGRLQAPLVYCNAVGGNDELLFDGHSLVATADGQLRHAAPGFVAGHQVVDLAQPVGEIAPLASDIADLEQALVMGIRDYAGRCGFRSAVLGSSGGIDSAVVAALATRALGPENVQTVGMPGPFSSAGSVADAQELAQNLGVRFDLVPIGGIHDAFLKALAPRFEGLGPDVTEENLQARARGTVLMALSNKLGHLLLTTGNKSELGVGYCTLYGDMNGGLAVISDVFKTDVYRLARWLNRDGPCIPAAIIDKPPSAELAPDQRDADSLPPYAALDAILRLYVEGSHGPKAIIAAGHDAARVHRVIAMVVRAEYKRWQAAPGLRVSPKAFGTGRRIPLAQRWHRRGGEVETAE